MPENKASSMLKTAQNRLSAIASTLNGGTPSHHQFPAFDDLPKVEGEPHGCIWGFFDKNGVKDECGSMLLWEFEELLSDRSAQHSTYSRPLLFTLHRAKFKAVSTFSSTGHYTMYNFPASIAKSSTRRRSTLNHSASRL